MKKDIESLLGILDRSIEWGRTYRKDTFPLNDMREYRRRTRKIAAALEENCSAAAYGESQVGKSYLISSLLSKPNEPFVVKNKDEEYNFIDEINPSGGNVSKTESTGVVTRFTINRGNERMKDYVKIRNLSISDLVMLLADSYYNDLKINPDTSLGREDINDRLDDLRKSWGETVEQKYLTEDDIKDIYDYMHDILAGVAGNVLNSDFWKIVQEDIHKIPVAGWTNVFSLLWNGNAKFTELFAQLIKEYETLGFETEVYVPFDAVLRRGGTLLRIDWLDSICGKNIEINSTDEPNTDVYNANEELLARAYKKSSLCALSAELTFVLPENVAEQMGFLKNIDLLDFPGARSREKFKEQDIEDVLPTVLRRGKVAYLFNKYSRSLQISSVLFCHHNDQKAEPTLGDTINVWIEENVGKTPEKRSEDLARTNGISRLFVVATKFNIELQRGKMDSPQNLEMLEEHWKRFNTVFPEIIKPATWFDNWTVQSGGASAFKSIYLLRDFYWSAKNGVFDGYEEGKSTESGIHKFPDYPNYFEALRESFLANDFVKAHFDNPSKSWDEVATINNDGSEAIIRDLNKISGELDSARQARYLAELKKIREDVLAKLDAYYEPEDKEQNNRRIRTIIGDIRMELDSRIGSNPEIFGNLIDDLMVPVNDIRKIVYDIVMLKRETPKDVTSILLIRTNVGINLQDDRQTNIDKLCRYYGRDSEGTLREHFVRLGVSLDDVLSPEIEFAATEPDVVANSILNYWSQFINRQTEAAGKFIPHADEIAFMLQTLCKRLKIKSKILEKVKFYYGIFMDKRDLPNAIADFSCLVLNNFVSTVGREYMSDDDLESVAEKARACGIQIDLSSEVMDGKCCRTSLTEMLDALEQASNPSAIPIDVLTKLPFYDNFKRWEILVAVGLLYSSDITHQDPVANAAIRGIMNDCKALYQNN